MAQTKVIVNCETGETTEVELTAEELAELETMQRAEQERAEAEAAALAKKEADKAAGIEVLKTLGLTDDQIKALIS